MATNEVPNVDVSILDEDGPIVHRDGNRVATRLMAANRIVGKLVEP